MKYFFDKKLLDYLSLELKAYEKKEILNSILNNDNIWSNINGKIILNNQIISIIKNKYPDPDPDNKGFEINDLYKIISSCIIDNFDGHSKLDKGVKVKNLEI